MTSFLQLIKERSLKNKNMPREGIFHEKMHSIFLAVSNAGKKGMTTREVAAQCDLTVYAARNWLLKLEAQGYLYKTRRPRNTTWHRQ